MRNKLTMQLINISRVVLLLLLSLMISCSHDDDDIIEDSEPQIVWNYGYTYSYEYEDVSLIGGELRASFSVNGESGNIEVNAFVKDIDGNIIDTQSETFFVEVGKVYNLFIKCRTTNGNNNESTHLRLNSPQSLRGYLLEFEELRLYSVEILRLEIRIDSDS
ncbi:hypothetical protein ACXR6G_07225 [Ancylomarina sp. YFZ004]